MKAKNLTSAAMVKKLAKEMINHVNEYQKGEQMEYDSRNARQWDDAQTQKGAAACDMMTTICQMLSELGCVLSIEGICGPTEYYVVEKKNF